MAETLTLPGFTRLVAAGTPLVFIVGGSEERCEALLARAAQGLKGCPDPLTWTCTAGFAGQPQTTEPAAAVRWAIEREGPGLFLFKDLHYFWQDDPLLCRTLRDFAARRRGTGKTLVFIAPAATIPADLRRDFILLEQGLPDRDELHAWLKAAGERDPFVARLLAEAADPTPLLLAAQGLELRDLDHALRLARVAKGGLAETVAALHQCKSQVLARSGIMELVVNDTRPDQVGGMDALKGWMDKRERAFGLAGMTSGAHLPKGVMLMGVSGCGKSLFVKAIAARWQLPIIRLDMATIYAGTFGSPETSLREACAAAESLAPCVLWIDEIEAGISSQGFKAEGGAASRVLGYFLTWMQEKRAPVFVAATANAIEMLPAEVLRKGRFDEIFYLALPALAEREEIFRIHLAKRGFDPGAFQAGMLAHGSKGFSGAEIEQAVASASFEALAQQRSMVQQDLMEALGRTVPLSVTMAEQIKKIEAWAFRRAVPASKASDR